MANVHSLLNCNYLVELDWIFLNSKLPVTLLHFRTGIFVEGVPFYSSPEHSPELLQYCSVTHCGSSSGKGHQPMEAGIQHGPLLSGILRKHIKTKRGHLNIHKFIDTLTQNFNRTSNDSWQGIIVTGVSFYLQTWCIKKRGPVFLAMSMPLTLVITIAVSLFILGEQINLQRCALQLDNYYALNET